jgi:hypothetical protein
LGKIDAPFFGASRRRKREKSGKGVPFFAVGGLASGLSAGRAGPDHLCLAYDWAGPLSRSVYRLSDGDLPPGVCAQRRWGSGAIYDFLGAYLGEEV